MSVIGGSRVFSKALRELLMTRGSYRKTTVLDGHVSPGYEPVRDMFKEILESGRDRNAQLCIYVGGKVVVDLWGSAEGDPCYDGDSLQCVICNSKTVTAIAVAQLVDRGLLNYTDPVAKYWPEFGENNKSQITVRDLLKHEGGIPHLNQPINYSDLLPQNLANGNVESALCQQVPQFPPNTPREYHIFTAGLVINQVFRRLSPGQQSIGAWLEREVTGPLGADVYLGVPDSLLARVSNLTTMSKYAAILHSLLPSSMGGTIDYNMLVLLKLIKASMERYTDLDSRGFVPHVPVDMADLINSLLQFCNSPGNYQNQEY